MEIRKLIKFGNNSFVISLPKTWVVKNKLNKGSLIYLHNTGNQILIAPQQGKTEHDDKEVTLDFREESIETVRRKIVSCYINNYKQIKIIFLNNLQAAQIREIIQNLVALEVIEQSSNVIIAKDYLNMDDISVQNLIRKSDTIIRTMIADMIAYLKKPTGTDFSENILARDSDVNRITFLIQRYVKYAFKDPELKKEGDDYDYLSYYLTAIYLERVGDELKRIGRMLTAERPKATDDVLAIFIEIEKLYLNVLKTYHNNDREAAFKIATQKNPLLDKLRLISDKNDDIVLERIYEMQRRTVALLNNLLRVVYQ